MKIWESIEKELQNVYETFGALNIADDGKEIETYIYHREYDLALESIICAFTNAKIYPGTDSIKSMESAAALMEISIEEDLKNLKSFHPRSSR